MSQVFGISHFELLIETAMSYYLPIAVLEAVAAELKPLGFKLVKSKKWFIRAISNRVEKYQLVVLDEKKGYRICPSVSVRFEHVEAIFHRSSGYEVEYQRDTPTVGIDLWSVYGKDGYQVSLTQAAGVDVVASQLLEIFHDKAMPYYSHFSSLVAVDTAINAQPSDNSVHRAMPWLRCSTGAIVAKLVGRDNYDYLVSIYTDILRKDSNGFYLPRFELLLSDIAKLTPDSDAAAVH
ncbi:hypothetical protein NA78x_000513 [Anatilimnocola sp. NA78]|uniref:hypothetical protein n=1 Tax=Anatilimnocola sp. NA78 TaxID=3415683 RepID=UPI003CE4B2B8